MHTLPPDLLERVRSGDQDALRALVELQYPALHRIASKHLVAERPGHTLQTTALVHEAFLKLCGDRSYAFADRVHFLAVASRVMRQVLVDYARARTARKRNPALQPGLENNVEAEPVDFLDLDSALSALGDDSPDLARLVELRYFGGMSAEDIAELLQQSIHVVRYDLKLAHAWLRRKLSTRPQRA
jgi:RNA polymerase sigma factor (TIGR02999 family)